MPERYRFGRNEVWPDERLLLVEGLPAVIGARAFDLLLALLDHRQRVVTKDELLQTVWHGVAVGDNNLHTQISTLRALLGQQVIVTVPGRGYRFAAKVATESALVSAAPSMLAHALAVGPANAIPRHPGESPSPPPMRFGPAEVRPVERQLFVSGQPAAIGSRAFDVLLTLIELRPRVVSKDELLDRVWAGVVVEENNLQTQVSSLRKWLGPQAIETIPGLGYRFAMALNDDVEPEVAAPSPTPFAAPATARLTNVSAVAEALFGRSSDIEGLTRLQSEHRLVTVLGSGGIGKTSVARALARRLVGSYANGVWWVDLAALSSGGGIASAMANAAGLSLGEGDALASLLRVVSTREALFVLDNCEGLVADVASIVHALLAAGPRVRVVATSQERLRLPSEQVYRLDPLAIPPLGTPLSQVREHGAMQLFEQRARAIDRHFSLNTGNVAAATRLCRRLDGIPLAIEMAAARLPLLGVDGLDAELGERLRLLRSNSRSAPARQETLRATLDWSHALLADDEKGVLRRLSAFAGSFGLHTAKQVAVSDSLDEWGVVDAMAALVDKSLVQVEPHDPPRYRLLETTRLYAAERLVENGEMEATMRRHGQAMSRLAEEIERAYWDMPDSIWLRRYVPDYDDLQAAFDRACLSADADIGASVLDALFRLDHLRATFPPIRSNLLAATRLLQSAGALADARLHLRLSNYGVPGASVAPRLPAAQRAVAGFRDLNAPLWLYEAQLSLAVNCAIAGRFEDAEKSLSDADGLEDPRWPPRLHWLGAHHRGRVRSYCADAAAYKAHARAELSFAEQAGSPCQAANARINLIDALVMGGDWDEAVACARAAVAELRALDLPYLQAVCLVNLCAALLRTGDLPAARAIALEALPVVWQNDLSNYLLCHLSLLAADSSRPEYAARMLGKVDGWLAADKCTLEPNEAYSIELAAQAVEAALDATDAATLRRMGAALTDTQAYTLAEGLIADLNETVLPGGAAASALLQPGLKTRSTRKR